MSGTLPIPGSLAGIEPAPMGMVQAPAPELDPAILNGSVVPHPDGGAEIIPQAPEVPDDPKQLPHDANLVDALDDSVLSAVAQDLLDGIAEDESSNAELWETLAEGLKLLGLKPGNRIDQRFKGASGVTHPLLKSALMRFHAQASGEILPAGGPVRSQIIGEAGPDQDKAVEAIAERKQSWLNYYLTEVDVEYEQDIDQGLLFCGLHGTIFRKVFRDPLFGGHPVSRFLSVYDLLVNSAATSLTGGWRVTEITPVTRGMMKRYQIAGYFADIDLVEPDGDATPRKAQTEKVTWQRPTQRIEDADHVVFTCRCELDLQGMEHLGEDGEPSGMLLPYKVWIDRDSEKVLRVERNWKDGDPDCRWKNDIEPFRYAPGLGFYGWGLIHLAGDTTDALTTMWRQGLDAYTFAAFPGGLRTKGARPEQSDIRVGPGEFAEIDTGGQPLSNAVMPLPYRDVPASFPVMHEAILNAGRDVSSTAELNVGDGRQDAPVGTTIALIEQSQKVENAVIRRLHRSQRRELRLLADLFGEGLPDEVYPYLVNGKSGQAIATDFADNADIIPVADPNAPTQTLRLAKAQGKIQLAQQFPGMVDGRAAVESMLRTAGESDAEIARLMPPPQMGMPSDPVTEFAMLTKGMPLKADPAQDHAAHIQCHMGQMAAPGLMDHPAGQQLVAHVGEHLGMFYAGEAARLTGVQVPQGQPVPPEMQAQIATAVAAATDQLRQSLLQLAPDQGAGGKSAQELGIERLKLEVSERDSDRKAQETARQDQVTLIQLKENLANDALEREAKLRSDVMALVRDAIKAEAGLENGKLGMAGNVIDAVAQMHGHQHETHQSSVGLAEAAVKADADKAKADATKAAAESRNQGDKK